MKCLIVDDAMTARELLKDILSPYMQCEVAPGGPEAVEAVRRALDAGEPYDLICLDIMMPKVDGHEVLETIRHAERSRGIGGSDGTKIIMTTAVTNSKCCIQTFREGCECYLTKPIDEGLLLRQVRSLVGELAEPSPRSSEHAAPPPEPRPAGNSPPSDSPASECCAATSADPARKLQCPVGLPAQPAIESCAATSAQRAGMLRRPIRLRAQPAIGHYLIVDDDKLCRVLLKDILSAHGQCDLVHSGQEAVEAVRLALEDGSPYDLVTLDIMMPGFSGHDALKAIRQLESEHGIGGSDGVKVIMTTALSDSKHCIASFKEGCECYLTKPIREQELLDKMRELALVG